MQSMPIELVNNDTDSEEQLSLDQNNLCTNTYNSSQILQSLVPSLDSFITCLSKLLKPDHSFDTIVENERGFNLCGFQFFSSRILIPGYDPANLTNLYDEPIQSLNLFPLQNENEWKWVWDQWYVLIFNESIGPEGDTDDKGWYYNSSFTGQHWRGKFKILGMTFVRRRLWIRLREKI